MSSKVEELVKLFSEKSYIITMGAPTVAEWLDCSEDDVREARRIIRSGDAPQAPKGKLKSRWQNASGEWLESYKFDEEDDNSLDEFKSSLLSELTNLGSLNASYDKSKKSGDKLMEINIPDFHFGKIDGNTIEEQAQKFIDAGVSLFTKAYSDDVNKILLPIGNDFFNSEATSTTTKGTPQQNNAEFYKIFSIGWKAIIKLVNWLNDYAKVEIIIVPGNHDTNATVMLGEVLEAYYNSNNNVNIDGGQEQTKYYRFGKNLFMYNHGDKTKGNDLVVRMAIENPIDFSQTKYRFIKLGHFHKNIVLDETMGVSIEYMPSLCSSDKWHRDNHYLSQPKSHATLYDKELGKHSVYNIYIDNI